MFKKEKKMFKIGRILASLVVMLLMLPVLNVQASTFSISGPSSVNANTNFTVTFGSGTTGAYSYSVSGGTIVSSSSWVEGGGSLTVKSGTSGTVSVTVSAVNVTDSSYNDVTGSKSVSVKINTSTSSGSSASSSNNSNSSASASASTTSQVVDERSSDNTLKSLSVEGADLSPEFSSSVTNYSVVVWDVSSITIGASAKDGKATVTGAGKIDLALGENKLDVNVKAENGSLKTYSINVTLNQNPTIFMEYDGKSLGVVKNLINIDAFSGFDRCVVEYELQDVEGWYSSALDLTVLYMVDEDDLTGFYIFEDDMVVSELKEYEIAGEKYFIFEVSEELQEKEGLTYGSLLIEELEIMGWSFDSDKLGEYYLIQLMNQEGELIEFLYSNLDGTMVINPGLASITMEEFEDVLAEIKSLDESIEQKNLVLMISGVLNLLFLIIIIIILIKIRRSKKYSNDVDVYEDEEYEDEEYEDEEDDDLDDFDESEVLEV